MAAKPAENTLNRILTTFPIDNIPHKPIKASHYTLKGETEKKINLAQPSQTQNLTTLPANLATPYRTVTEFYAPQNYYEFLQFRGDQN